MATVLKKFPWAKDGFTVEMLSPGAEADFGAASHGLAAEGYISLDAAITPADEPVVEPVVLPVVAAEPEPVVATEPAQVADTVVEPEVEPVVEQPAPRTRKSR